MKFESTPQLPLINITNVAPSQLGRFVVNTVDGLPYFDTGTAWMAMSGNGGLSTIISDTPPTSPNNAELWWDSTSGNLKIFWSAAGAWIEAFTGKQGLQGPQGPAGPQGPQGPQGPAGIGGSGPFLINPKAVGTASVRWLPYVSNATALTTLAQTANRGIFIPFTVGNNVTFTRIIITVTTASTGTSYAGIYSDNSGSPGSLLIGTAGMSTGATGDVVSTVTSTTLSANTVYWMYITSSAAATLRAVAVASIIPMLGFTPANTTAYTFIYQTLSGSPPATAPSSGYTLGTGTVPAIFLAP
jgi:hypothetical protein